MKTKIKKIKCAFGQIYVGDVFKDCHDDFYMKISEVECKNGLTFILRNAVKLENGILSTFENEDSVSQSNGTFSEE